MARDLGDGLRAEVEVLRQELRLAKQREAVWQQALFDVDKGTWRAVRRHLGLDEHASPPGTSW